MKKQIILAILCGFITFPSFSIEVSGAKSFRESMESRKAESLKAIVEALVNQILSCGNEGKIFGPAHATADANGCVSKLIVKNNSNGYVGVGTQSPSHPLTVNGNVKATAYYHTSDSSYKSNINKINGLDIINHLEGVTFNWKKDNTPGVGVIAQQVEKVIPQLVSTSPEGIKSVDYDGLIAPLIESVKELNSQVILLKHQLNELEKKVITTDDELKQ